MIVDKKDQDSTSIEEYAPELLIKHPLQHTWTLWYYETDRTRAWDECQKEVISFNTAEDFWSLYNHIKSPSELKSGCDYSMFKQGIRPMWEDDANKNGGKWVLQLDKKQRLSDLDNFWLEIVLCMIGEAFHEHSDDVCGAVASVRPKGDRIGIWTADFNKSQAVLDIGRKLKERLKIQPKQTIGYQVHRDTMVKAGSVTKNTYSV
ncbi:eukaryotic translation initiation factor 4E-1A-like isoform X2 [Aphidius gifuensis]|uniref:eukaryotic translation initiation factor 4E-1A-like isoform X2 n=1 Tax=Aphidius gifuensis TaxID=684658 RepID=UPI001CDBA978|nr:eukaryotic translation initiation factor 4E-1A-like isoform X2 [Aphidius gifuensis]